MWRWKGVLCFFNKLVRWRKRCVQSHWYLEFSLEREECGVWKIPNEGFKSLLAFWKNVSHLGWESLFSNSMTIHGCKPFQQAQPAHQGRFICSRHNKWLDQATYIYDQHKQVNFHYQCSLFFPQMSNNVLLMFNIVFLNKSIVMDHMKPSLIHDFFHI